MHKDTFTLSPAVCIRLRELVYADDICLLASLPEQLQALIDALAAYCATLQMGISVPKQRSW